MYPIISGTNKDMNYKKNNSSGKVQNYNAINQHFCEPMH